MADSNSLIFPFKYDYQNECLLRSYTVEDTIISTIKAFLITKKGSRVGSNLGSFLPELLLQGIPSAKLSNLADELKTELESQFAGVNFLEVILNRENVDNISTLYLKIKLSIPTSIGVFDININFPTN